MTQPPLLTAKQQRFVEEYVVDWNATQAALRAGYSEKTAYAIGHENLSKPHIAEAIAARRTALGKKAGVTTGYVLDSIVSTMERCKQAEPVVDRKGVVTLTETPDGDLAKAYTFNAGGVLRGAELLGKHLGMFTEKVEHTGKDGGPIEFSNKDRARKLLFLLAEARNGAKAATKH